VKPGEEIVFCPHTQLQTRPLAKSSLEMHHSRVDFANPGDDIGLSIKDLDKIIMPRCGDVTVHRKDATLGQTKEFSAQIQSV